jgi:integrase/recombinase XerD
LAWVEKYVAQSRPKLLAGASSPLLYVTNTGRMMHPNQLSALVRAYLERAGIAKRGACHIFRHTAATLMLEGGADARYIQALLGHASLATTQLYTHVSIQKLREVHAKTHPARLHRPEPTCDGQSQTQGQAQEDGGDDRGADRDTPQGC